MKIFWIVLGVVVLALAINALVNYLLQRKRQQRAEKDGVVLYATVVSATAAGGLMKYAEMKKVTLRLQDPGATTPREVSLRTRLPAGQTTIAPGARLAVIIDPKNKERIYPASAEAAKRVVMTGSRLERRHLRVGGTTAKTAQPQRDAIPYPKHLNRR